MIAGAAREVWQLPSGTRFLDAAASAVARGGATALILEDWVDRYVFLDELRSHLSSRGMTLQGVQDDGFETGSPLSCLLEGLGLPEVRSQYDIGNDAIMRFLAQPELPDATAVIVAERRDTGPSRWIDFARTWSSCSKRVSDSGGTAPSLCILLSPSAVREHDLPTDVQLSTAWMAGVPEGLEVRLICRLLDEGESPAARRWREHVLPALCGTDLGLLPALWTSVFDEPDAILASLDEYASQRHWSVETLSDLGIDTLARSQANLAFDGEAPPTHLRRAWSSGAVTMTSDHGLEVNSAARPLLGAQDVLMQRLWRGQVGLVLPAVDGIRMAMCSQLTRNLGPGWATDCGLPPIEDEAKALRESPLSCQWGHLLYLLRRHRRLSDYADWIPLVRLSREARNSLAHGSPVSYSRYSSLVDAARACGFAQWL